MRRLKLLQTLVYCLFALYAGCSYHDIKLEHIVILTKGYEKGGEFCSDFSLRKKDAEAYFQKAVVIDAQQLAQSDWLPCYVTGTALYKNKPVEWSIRAGGTATVVSKQNETTYFICESCNYGH